MRRAVVAELPLSAGRVECSGGDRGSIDSIQYNTIHNITYSLSAFRFPLSSFLFPLSSFLFPPSQDGGGRGCGRRRRRGRVDSVCISYHWHLESYYYPR